MCWLRPKSGLSLGGPPAGLGTSFHNNTFDLVAFLASYRGNAACSSEVLAGMKSTL